MQGNIMARVVIILMILLPAELFPQVIVNEIMKDPDFAPDTDGEWIELHNTGDSAVDINGWTIRDDGSNLHQIETGSPLLLSPGGYLLLGRTTDRLINGDVPVTYAYGSDITLGNGADQVVLIDTSGIEVDRVNYDDGVIFPDPSGASMELIHPRMENNDGSSWATALTAWAGHDLGTPGSANSVLDTIPPALAGVSTPSESEIDVRFTEIVDTVSAEDLTNYDVLPGIGIPLSASVDLLDPTMVHLTTGQLEPGIAYQLTVSNVRDRSGNAMTSETISFTFSSPPGPGSIIVTEIMKDPDAVGDASGEWFEVYNTTADTVSMQGWTISDDASNAFTVSGALRVPPLGFAVFAINVDSATNGGMSAPLMYDWGSSSTFALSNTADKIIIWNGVTTIDSVSYTDSSPWPDPTGASIGLTEFSSDNNDGANWSIAPVRELYFIGASGDLGSPGLAGENQSTGTSGVLTVFPAELSFISGTGDRSRQELQITNHGADSIIWSAVGSVQSGNWLLVCPTDGIVAPLATDTLMVTADASGLKSGLFIGVVEISSAKETVQVSVTLQILDTLMTGSISLAADSLPVPPGGREIPMEIAVRNLTGLTRQTDVWVALQIPGQTDPRLIVGPQHPVVAPYDSLLKPRSLHIPSHAPAGIYRLDLALGEFPDSISFLRSYQFEKTDAEIALGSHKSEGDLLEPYISDNYPNPFNSSTVIEYGLSEDTWVTITVFNMLGQEVSRIVDQFERRGRHIAMWHGTNQRGQPCGTGTYLVAIRAGSFSKSGWMTLLR